jgi:hypothetical protein
MQQVRSFVPRSFLSLVSKGQDRFPLPSFISLQQITTLSQQLQSLTDKQLDPVLVASLGAFLECVKCTLDIQRDILDNKACTAPNLPNVSSILIQHHLVQLSRTVRPHPRISLLLTSFRPPHSHSNRRRYYSPSLSLSIILTRFLPRIFILYVPVPCFQDQTVNYLKTTLPACTKQDQRTALLSRIWFCHLPRCTPVVNSALPLIRHPILLHHRVFRFLALL